MLVYAFAKVGKTIGSANGNEEKADILLLCGYLNFYIVLSGCG